MNLHNSASTSKEGPLADFDALTIAEESDATKRDATKLKEDPVPGMVDRSDRVVVIDDVCDNYLNDDGSIHGYFPSELDPDLIGRVASQLIAHAEIGCRLSVKKKDNELEMPDAVFGGAIAKLLDKESETFVGYLMIKKAEWFATRYLDDNPAVWLSPYHVYDIKALGSQIVDIARENGIVPEDKKLSDTVHIAIQVINPVWKEDTEQSLSSNPELQFPGSAVAESIKYPDFLSRIAHIRPHHATDSIVAHLYLAADKKWSESGNSLSVPGSGVITPHTGMLLIHSGDVMHTCCSSRPLIDSKTTAYEEGTARHVLQIRIPYLQ